MTQIRISEDAFEDLNKGYLFHEDRQPGLGDYFASCIRSDIEGLRLTAGMHRVMFRDYFRLVSKISPMAFSIPLRMTLPLFGQLSIYGEILNG